jgi:ATP-dependent helicase/nuclease subunit A
MSVACPPAKTGFTREQTLAIETDSVSVALSAGAGCGKTFVLTERFLSCFDPDKPGSLAASDLGQVVAITFTERAAREMRDRVRKKCYERLEAATRSEHIDHWASMLRGLDAARISTIHSFCGWLLRARAAAVGIDPRFEVLEQAQVDALVLSTVDDELRRLVARRDPDVIDLAVRFDLGALADMLHDLVVDLGTGRFDVWLDRGANEQLAAWQEFHQRQLQVSAACHLAESTYARQMVDILTDCEPTHQVMRERRGLLLASLSELRSGKCPEGKIGARLEEIRQWAQVRGGGGAKAWPNEKLYQTFMRVARKVRESIDKLDNLLTFDGLKVREAAETGCALLKVAAGASQRYAQRKRELAALDFDDLLREARTLLVDPDRQALRRQLGAQLRLLLVDEFQDTDPLQVELIEALCGDAAMTGKLFFVGDYKQSIYRFRGADPRVFRRLRDRTPRQGQLKLTRNFRSQPAILEFVNALFWEDMDEYEPLHADRPQASQQPCVEFLWAALEDTDAAKGTAQAREADWIARRVRQILDDGEPLVGAGRADDKMSLRPAQLGDIVILFRALSDVEHYEIALRRWGVDYYLVGGHAFYAQQEIFDLLNLLRAVASPSDTLSLVGVLRSGFFSLADETIFWLSRHPEGVAAGLEAAELPAGIPPHEQERVRFVRETLARLRGSKDQLSIAQLIERALDLTGYDAALVNEFLGERKLANLQKLVDQARSFETGGHFSLGDFAEQLSRFIARQPQEPLAATLGENMNAVRLMTVHQAKGLEFPIVIVPDLDRLKFSQPPRVKLDKDLGPLVKVREDDDFKSPPSGFDLWRFVEEKEDLDEMVRLLYVATTRAADYLILSAGGDVLEKASGPWMQLLARRFDLQGGQLIGRLPENQPRPRVVVTTTEPALRPSALPRRPRLDRETLDEAVGLVRHAPAFPLRSVEVIPPDSLARQRFSFSWLSGALEREEEPVAYAERAEGTAAQALGLGTLVHAVLAAIDFSKPGQWRPLVTLHAERLQIDDREPVAEATRLIEQFMDSPRAASLAAADQSMAEVEFLLKWPPKGAAKDGRNIVLSGFIDRLYQDAEGSWHVIDFKTNRVTQENLPHAAAAYEMQMLVYAMATETILGRGPKTLALHFLRTGTEHPFAWDENARGRAIELVNQGIKAASRQPNGAAGPAYRPSDAVL